MEGRGVRSLAGIERAADLRWLVLLNTAVELAPVGSLSRLELLMIRDLGGVVDYTPLARLEQLRSLDIVINTRAEAEALACLDLSAARALTSLSMNWLGAGPPVPYALRWSQVPRNLRVLALHNFAVSDSLLDVLCHTSPPSLSRIHLHLNAEQYERLQADVPQAAVFPYDDSDPEEIRPYAGSREGFSFSSDVAGHWGLDAAVEAAEALETMLDRVAPDVASRVEISNGGGAVWVDGTHLDDLTMVRDLIRRRARER